MIAVTGAGGLLGSCVVDQFVAEGEQVVAIQRSKNENPSAKKIIWKDANVKDLVSLTESFKDVDTVIHSAALVSFNPRKSKEVFDTNVEGTKNVVNACLAAGVKKLIHVSSVAALGRKKGVTSVDENNVWIDSSLNSDYATSKYLAELEVYRGYEEGLHVSLVNPSVILGPADWTRSSSQIFKYIWDEKPFYTEGVINFVDVRDVASMIYKLHKSDFNGERFIASAGHTSFKKIFDEIATRFGTKTPSLKVDPSLTRLVAAWEAVRCFLTNSEPVITRHTVRMAREPFFYESKKAVEKLEINFRSLAETLDFCCPYYAQKITTNK